MTAHFDGAPCKKCGSTERYVSTKKCIKCDAARCAKWREANRDKMRGYLRKHYAKLDPAKKKARGRRNHLKYTYGIAVEEYDAKYVAQHGRCAICLVPKDVLCVDHNHDTQEVRGLLCVECNAGLGYLRESPTIISKAIDYLDYHNRKEEEKTHGGLFLV